MKKSALLISLVLLLIACQKITHAPTPTNTPLLYNQVIMQYIIPKSLFYTANLQYSKSPYN
jgi:hypothetical protein